MKVDFRRRRRTETQPRLLLESLESRGLLSVYPTGITAASPSAGALLDQPPQEIEIAFDAATLEAAAQFLSNADGADVPPAAILPSLLSSADVQLVSINSDGSTTPIFDFDDDALKEQVDATGTELIVPMQLDNSFTGQPVNVNLAPGTYAIQLTPDTGLSDVMSESFSDSTPPYWDPTSPLTISTFTVLGKGATFADATPLTLSTSTSTHTFTINPNDYQSAVDLYKISLPAGQPGRLEVGLTAVQTTTRKPLVANLTLFDANGNVLAESHSGEGTGGNPDEPYIFVGVSPTALSNTYYIGVSGYGNAPYGATGYNPVLGIPGTSGLNQPGGPFSFQLSLSEQPEAQPAKLVDFTLGHADPTDTSPTSLTLTFSSPIDISPLFVPDHPETAIDVVDSSGKVWPTTAVAYQANNDQLTLLFDTALPPGQYSLVIPASGGLTDPAGQAIATSGESGGVLATWNVDPATGTKTPDDLGVLWPSNAGVVWPNTDDAFQGTVALAPGQSVSYRWVVIVPGFYAVQTQNGDSALEIVNTGNGTSTVLDPGSTDSLRDDLMYLAAGTYELRFANVGTESDNVRWELTIEALDWELIVANGVNQSSALSLTSFQPISASAPIAGTDTISAVQGLMSVGLAPALATFSSDSGPLPPSLFVTANSNLVGQPGISPGPISVAAGSEAEFGIAAAGGFTGQSAAPAFGSSSPAWSEPAGDDDFQLHEEATPETGPSQLPSTASWQSSVKRADARSADSLHADQTALAHAEWLGRVGAWIGDWLTMDRVDTTSMPSRAVVAAARSAAASTAEMTESEIARDLERRRASVSHQRELAILAGVFTVGATAFQLRKPLKRWWRQDRSRPGAAPYPTRTLPRPHQNIARSNKTSARLRNGRV